MHQDNALLAAGRSDFLYLAKRLTTSQANTVILMEHALHSLKRT